MGREFELKYRADGACFAHIQAAYGPFTPITMETAYYDAPDGALRSRFWTLRRRLENGVSVCTVKTPASGGARGEWEVACDHLEDAIPMLVERGAPEELIAFTKNGIEQTCAARFTRLAATVTLEGCTVELALDQGVLLGGGNELPFAEVEVELKQGSEALAVSFARILAQRYGLTPEPRSKVQRALALAK